MFHIAWSRQPQWKIFTPELKIQVAWTFIASITLIPYVVLPLFATKFAAYAGGIRVSFTQPRLF